LTWPACWIFFAYMEQKEFFFLHSENSPVQPLAKEGNSGPTSSASRRTQLDLKKMGFIADSLQINTNFEANIYMLDTCSQARTWMWIAEKAMLQNVYVAQFV
jgi:hypothetical protein